MRVKGSTSHILKFVNDNETVLVTKEYPNVTNDESLADRGFKEGDNVVILSQELFIALANSACYVLGELKDKQHVLDQLTKVGYTGR